MFRHLCTVFVLLIALACGTQAQAACTAGNANPKLAESTPSSAFTDHGDGTVTHSLTGLMWQQCSVGQSGVSCAASSATSKTWIDALAAARDSRIAGYTDWRLPNVRELESLVETCGYTPSINQELFPATVMGAYYWSASPSTTAGKAWAVNFQTSTNSSLSRSNSNFVRLVRGGYALDYFDAQPDTLPNVFSFTAQTGAALGSTATSNTITVAGISADSPISISGGSYKIGSGSYTAAAGTVSNGNTVTVQQTASSSPSTLTTATLTIGTISAAFNVTTAAISSQTITFNNLPYAHISGMKRACF